MIRRAVVPCAMTMLGMIAGAVGVALLPGADALPWLFMSVAVDAIDGRTARWLHAETVFGARLDWTVDTALSYAMVFRMLPGAPATAVAAMTALIGTQASASALGCRFSGRTLVTALVAIAVAS